MMSFVVQNPAVMRAALPIIYGCDLHYALTINSSTYLKKKKLQISLKITFFHTDLVLMKEYQLVVLVNEALCLQICIKANFSSTVVCRQTKTKMEKELLL